MYHHHNHPTYIYPAAGISPPLSTDPMMKLRCQDHRQWNKVVSANACEKEA